MHGVMLLGHLRGTVSRRRPTTFRPLRSKRATISPMRPRCTPSGLTRTRVRSMDRCCSCCGVGGAESWRSGSGAGGAVVGLGRLLGPPGGPQQVAVQQPIGRLRSQRRLRQGTPSAATRVEPQGKAQLAVALVLAAGVVGQARAASSRAWRRPSAPGRWRGRGRGGRPAERRGRRRGVGRMEAGIGHARREGTPPRRRQASSIPTDSMTRSISASARSGSPAAAIASARPAARSAAAAPGCRRGWCRSPWRRPGPALTPQRLGQQRAGRVQLVQAAAVIGVGVQPRDVPPQAALGLADQAGGELGACQRQVVRE